MQEETLPGSSIIGSFNVVVVIACNVMSRRQFFIEIHHRNVGVRSCCFSLIYKKNMKPYESKAGYKSVLLSAFLLRFPVASLRRFASLQHQLMIRSKIYVLEKLRFEKLTNSGEAQQKILVY